MSTLISTSPTQPLLTDVILYVRRILKQPNQQDISDVTICDYLNRFYCYDVPARIQTFELKTQYSLELTPNVDQYNAPITYLPSGINNTVVPTYNSFIMPAFVDGYPIIMQQSHNQWNSLFPNRMMNQYAQNGTNSAGPYSFSTASFPIVQGHRDQNIQPVGNNTNPRGALEGLLTSSVYITATDVNGLQNVIQDDPFSSVAGALIQSNPLTPGVAPVVVGLINYLTGQVSITNFLNVIPSTSAINYQIIPYTPGRPQGVLFYNNIFSFRPIPDKPYLFQIDAYYNPAAFLNTTDAIPYRFMAEYLARGTATKILQDYGDVEQLALYEPMLRQQENFVLRKTYRQNSNIRVPTIFQGRAGNSQNSINGIW